MATGLAPDAASRWAAVQFDPASYEAWQANTSQVPFAEALRARTVVFDPTYFALDRSPRVRGLVGWGAHDPGVASVSRPAGLLGELHDRFGPCPAKEWIYGVAWPSPEHVREMGRSLAAATRMRAAAAAWFLTEKVSDWELALVTVSEPHSVIEGLWHGIDTAHPLHALPSASAAACGVRSVYRAVDELVGDLIAAAPDAAVVLFAMHGMGSNGSDVASMLLLPELLYRRAFGKALFDAPASSDPHGVPLLGPGEKWMHWVERNFPAGSAAAASDTGAGRDRMPWMPAAWYAPHWPAMDCFALPSFYDGRIRVNLQGRERLGRVALRDYHDHCDRIEVLLRDCVDPRNEKSIVDSIERPVTRDPLRLDPTEADLVIVWHGAPLALLHRDYGLIGPAPYRRTGGHTGPNGFAWIAAPGIEPGDEGPASSFDVVPTLVELVGEEPPARMSGHSLLRSRPATA